MNLTAKQFDLGNARECAAVSAAAYGEADAALAWFPDSGAETICDGGTDTHALILNRGGYLILAFRGTASIRNWITDAEFERVTIISGVDGSSSKVHKGFNAAWNAVLGKLFHALGDTANAHACKPMFITGHSLGGALAQMAALALQRNGFPVAQIYTFGQPRVGNGDFKRRYEAALGDKTFRVVYEEDIVARVPHLPAWHDPYRHAGTEVFLPAFGVGKLVIDPSIWFLLASDAWGIYRAFMVSKFAGALDPILDHHIDNYVRGLNNLPDRSAGTPDQQHPL